MSPVTLDRAELADTLREIGADAWLLFDFHGINPVTNRVLGISGGMATRRLFVLLPAAGEFVAVAHKIELQPVAGFPGKVVPYARWEELHRALEPLVAGRTIAMEVSTEDAVPYLDRVPHGVVQLITKLGGTVVSSAPLVTRFAARWQPSEVEDHTFAAEVLARVAQDAIRRAISSINEGLTESAMQAEVIRAMEAGGLELDTLPIVGFGANGANPCSTSPSRGRSRPSGSGDVVLLDLWGGRSKSAVSADQTWMGYAGASPPERIKRNLEHGAGGPRSGHRGRDERGGSGPAAGRLPGGPGRSRRHRGGGLRRGLRPPDRPLDRPGAPRIRSPPGQLRNAGRPPSHAGGGLFDRTGNLPAWRRRHAERNQYVLGTYGPGRDSGQAPGGAHNPAP